MKTLLLAATTGFALMLAMPPSFAATSHPGSTHKTGEQTGEQTWINHWMITTSRGDNNGGASCADILANRSGYARDTVRSCE